MMAPRGVRNHNPGNLKLGDPWQGLAKIQDDPVFCKFQKNSWGFRALAVLLVHYQDNYGINTIGGVIKRYAPPEDNNNTLAYIQDVCRITGYTETQPLNFHQYTDSWKVCRAITFHEQGGFDEFFQNWELDEGLRRAGIEGVPVKPLRKSLTAVSAGVTTLSVVAQPIADHIQATTQAWSPTDHTFIRTGLVIVGFVFGALAIYGRMRIQKQNGV